MHSEGNGLLYADGTPRRVYNALGQYLAGG